MSLAVASCRVAFLHMRRAALANPFDASYATIVSRCFEKNRKEPRVNAMLRWVHVVSLRMM